MIHAFGESSPALASSTILIYSRRTPSLNQPDTLLAITCQNQKKYRWLSLSRPTGEGQGEGPPLSLCLMKTSKTRPQSTFLQKRFCILRRVH